MQSVSFDLIPILNSFNREQAIHVKSFNQSFYFMVANVRDGTVIMATKPHKRREQLQAWFNVMKNYCTMQNLKSYYEIG
jgi:hypothetical protein